MRWQDRRHANSKMLSAQCSNDQQGCQWQTSSPVGRPQDYTHCIVPRLQHHAWSDLDLTNKAENSLDMSVDKAHDNNMVNKAWQFAKQNRRKTRGIIFLKSVMSNLLASLFEGHVTLNLQQYCDKERVLATHTQVFQLLKYLKTVGLTFANLWNEVSNCHIKQDDSKRA